jgi:hypothetical protein
MRRKPTQTRDENCVPMSHASTHCWHSTGKSFTNSNGTVHDAVCCHCGIAGHRVDGWGVPNGHGSYAPLTLVSGPWTIGKRGIA